MRAVDYTFVKNGVRIETLNTSKRLPVCEKRNGGGVGDQRLRFIFCRYLWRDSSLEASH